MKATLPTVTAVKLPASLSWDNWTSGCGRERRCRGNYGPLARVFRLGMGTQADETLVQQTLDALKDRCKGSKASRQAWFAARVTSSVGARRRYASGTRLDATALDRYTIWLFV